MPFLPSRLLLVLARRPLPQARALLSAPKAQVCPARHGRRRPLSTTTMTAPPPAAAAAAAAEGERPKESTSYKWMRRAAYVLGPLSIPTAVLLATIYDLEFRADLEEMYPELVDYIRQHVGFEEDMQKRRKKLEKEFLLSQPLGVRFQDQLGLEQSETVSPLATLRDLSSQGGAAGVVRVDFDDVSDEEVIDPIAQWLSESAEPLAADDKREQVAGPLVGVMSPSLWDDTTPAVMKKSAATNSVEGLQASLADVEEALKQVKEEYSRGSERAVDDVELDLRFLRKRRRELLWELYQQGDYFRLLQLLF